MGKIITALALTLIAGQAVAAPKCDTPDRMYAFLGEWAGETRHFTGLAANGELVEIWKNQNTGSWTAVVTTADGKSCMVASGEVFMIAPGLVAGVPG